MVALFAACGKSNQPAASPATGGTPSPRATGGPVARLDMAEASPILTVRTAGLMDFQTGVSSLATGDFNGDGVGDLLIGLPFADGPDEGREDAGEAVVIFGGAGLEGEIDLAEDELGLRVLGALPGDTLGFGVAAGDLNGDGIDDVIVGAPGSNGLQPVRTDLGEAYVVFGRRDLGGTVDTARVEQDFTLIAAEGFARLGTSFAVADVNDDGIADLIAGAPFGGRQPGTPPGGPRTTLGEVYVVFGAEDLAGGVSVAEDEQAVLIAGARELDSFGESVAAADVNGDGVADIIVGARGFDGPEGKNDDAGVVMVFIGSAGLGGRLGVDDAGLTILGRDAGDGLGAVVASGDFNGDGLADIVAANRTGEGSGNTPASSVEAYIVLGSDSPSGTLDTASQEPDAIVYGAEQGALTATALATGDLDGDGRDDLLLGTPLAPQSGRALSGLVYLVFGRDLSGAIELSGDAWGGLVIQGADEGDALGTGAIVGDVHGDGRLRIVLAAAGDQGAEKDVGKIYVVGLP